MKLFNLISVIIFANDVLSENATENKTTTTSSEAEHTTISPTFDNVETRRILKGTPTGDIRPYMVYLKAASAMKKKQAERQSARKKKRIQNKIRMKHMGRAGKQKNQANPGADHKFWLCGGVIIHPEYVLTSAACIEDVQQFYVISGTSKWNAIDDENSCASNGALRATWKCVDQDYHYDGNNYDNIEWMKHDIAVVRVERPFNFTHRVLGCDFIPQKIIYNNFSIEFERSGTVGTIAGWGSTSKFFTAVSDFMEDDDEPKDRALGDDIAAQAVNSELLETDIKVMSKKNCKKVWEPRYHDVIDGDVLCSRDVAAGHGSICDEAGAKCVDIIYSEEDEDDDGDEGVRLRSYQRRNHSELFDALVKSRRLERDEMVVGGFCENDHGGPLIVGHGKKALVVGVMSAANVKPQTRECRGPFIFTSVYKHADLINCAVNKLSASCKIPGTGALRTREVAFNWDK